MADLDFLLVKRLQADLGQLRQAAVQQRRIAGLPALSGDDAHQHGKAVVQQCDRQLRATLQAAIQSGEAGACTVESCLALARERAAEEATQSYSQQVAR